ncbi:MAG: DUF4838 domain-containing protein [Lentisphaeria bacterium]|nr:DUF4838 domain-containing protein [Lentisphaeria bacterium]
MKKFLLVCGIAIFGILQLTAAAVPEQSDIAVLIDQKKPFFQIVLPDGKNGYYEFAAEELNHHLKKSTGVTLPVTAFSKRSSALHSIFLGIKPAKVRRLRGNHYFIVHFEDGNIFIYGDDRIKDYTRASRNGSLRQGTLMGVYEFLERAVGCRWLWPGELGEYVPAKRRIAIKQRDFYGSLPLRMNNFRVFSARRNGSGWNKVENYNKFIKATDLWLLRNRMLSVTFFSGGHAFTQYWQKYNKKHPEFFNMLPDGSRRPDPVYGSFRTISMCVTNGAFQDQVVKDFLSRPGLRINATENDTDGKCCCDKCMAADNTGDIAGRRARAKKRFLNFDTKWFEELGNLADRYVLFCNAVLNKARKHRPNAFLVTYFYTNYADAPVKARVAPGVISGVVPELTFPWSKEMRDRFRRQFDGWAKAGAQQYLRPNYTLYGHNLPVFYADHFIEDFDFALKRGLVGTDLDALTGQYATQGLNTYSVVRMHTKARLGVGGIFNEFFRSFGAAAPEIKEYFMLWKKISDAVDFDPSAGHIGLNYAGFAKFYISGPRIFPDKVFKQGFDILDRAEKKVRKHSVEAKRIKFLRTGLRHAQLTCRVEKIFAAEKYSRRFIAELDKLDAFRNSIEDQLGSDMYFLQFCENRTWDREFVKAIRSAGDIYRGKWLILFDEKKDGEKFYLQKPDARWKPVKVGLAYEFQSANLEYRAKHKKDFKNTVWYKTIFDMPAGKGKKAVFTIGAVDEACQVYVNGRLLLDRPFPYKGDNMSYAKAFTVEIPAEMLKSSGNDMSIKVINNYGKGGIWKEVFFRVE